MAADLSGNDESGMMSSINVTPFVDVVLVLLVIFMVTAPMLMKDILEIRLPKTSTGDGTALQTLGIAINKQGQILLNGQWTDEENLKKTAQQIQQQDSAAQAIISADEEVVYGRVVRVIDLLKSVGFERFAVQIEKKTSEVQQ